MSWKHAFFLAIAAVTLIGWGGSHAAPDAGPGAGLTNPGYHDKPEWFKSSFLDLRDDVKEAAAAGRRVLLYFYQDGCSYCKKLNEENFGQRAIADKTRRYFDTIVVNVWGDREVTNMDGAVMGEKKFAASLNVRFTPTLLFLDEKGKVALRVNGYYPPDKFSAALDYAGQHRESEMSFRDYYAGRAPAPAKGVLHQDPAYVRPPYRLRDLVQRSPRPLLVLFEQKQCGQCDELHLDIFKRPETRRELERLNIALFDMWSGDPVQTPAGAETTVERWARALDVKHAPTMVFFDAGGREVFRAEAYYKAFHVQSILDYVASGAYRRQDFQRFVQARAERLRAQGVRIDLME